MSQQVSSVSVHIWAAFSLIYLITGYTKETKKAVQPQRVQLIYQKWYSLNMSPLSCFSSICLIQS